MPKKPTSFKKYAEGGAVTKHQSMATSGRAPEGNGSNTQGYRKGGKVMKKGRRGC